MDFYGYDDIRLPHEVYETGLHVESLEGERLPSKEAKAQLLDYRLISLVFYLATVDFSCTATCHP